MPIFNPNQCVGIDLGLKRIAATSEGKIIKGNEFIKTKRKIRHLKRRLQSKKRTRTKKSDSARKHLRRIQKKEHNVSKNYIHHLANELLKTNSNTLVLEDLSSLKDKNRGRHQNNKLSQVPFYMLLTILKYKAQALGKRVETVNPAYTSKDDYRGVEKGVRKGCRYYAFDNRVWDADINAAINIGLRWGNKNKLPVSFVEPIDGYYRPNGQAVCQPANRLVL
jgi:IS605 OrfB family transposase